MSGKHAVKSSKKSLIIIICVVVLVAVIAGAVILFMNLSGKNNNSATTVPTPAASQPKQKMSPTLYPKPHSLQPNRVKLHKSRQNRDTQPKHLQMTVKLLFRQSAERSKSQNSVQLLFRTMQKTKILLKNILWEIFSALLIQAADLLLMRTEHSLTESQVPRQIRVRT